MQAQIQAETTFAAIATEFCEKRKRDGQKAWAPATATRSEYLLSLLKRSIGKLPIADIEPADVLSAVRKIEGKGKLESARRTLQLASAVFRYAVATPRLSSDPTRDLRGALTVPTVTHYRAIIDTVRVGELLRAIDGYERQPITKLAMQFATPCFNVSSGICEGSFDLSTQPNCEVKCKIAVKLSQHQPIITIFCF